MSEQYSDMDAAVTGQPADGGAPDDVSRQLAERTEDLQRVTAEYANYRRRVERDRVLVVDQAAERFAGQLFPIVDDIERARDHGDLTGAFRVVADRVLGLLDGLGVTAFGQAGDPFDPALHEAVLHDTSPEVSVPTATTVLRPASGGETGCSGRRWSASPTRRRRRRPRPRRWRPSRPPQAPRRPGTPVTSSTVRSSTVRWSTLRPTSPQASPPPPSRRPRATPRAPPVEPDPLSHRPSGLHGGHSPQEGGRPMNEAQMPGRSAEEQVPGTPADQQKREHPAEQRLSVSTTSSSPMHLRCGVGASGAVPDRAEQ